MHLAHTNHNVSVSTKRSVRLPLFRCSNLKDRLLTTNLTRATDGKKWGPLFEQDFSFWRFAGRSSVRFEVRIRMVGRIAQFRPLSIALDVCRMRFLPRSAFKRFFCHLWTLSLPGSNLARVERGGVGEQKQRSLPKRYFRWRESHRSNL